MTRIEFERARLSARYIMAMVAQSRGLTIDVMWSHGKARRFAYARQEAMYRVKQETGMGAIRLAKLFRRDHTTIQHGIKAHERRIAAQREGAQS